MHIFSHCTESVTLFDPYSKLYAMYMRDLSTLYRINSIL